MMFSNLRKMMSWTLALFWLAVQIYAAFRPMHGMLMYPIHLSCALGVAFLLKPLTLNNDNKKFDFIIDSVLVFCSLAVMAYLIVGYTHIVERIPHVDDVSSIDKAVCVLYAALILESGRRYLGWSMNAVCIVFIAYAFWGAELPGVFRHSGMDLTSFTEVQLLTTAGFFSSPIATSAHTVFYFMIFGAFLAATPAGKLFASTAQFITHKSQGGAGKATVVAAGLFGMISGSGPGNVATVGVIMNPMMLEAKFDPKFTAAIFATGGTGGLLIPPVMGATAFIMADMIGVPYLEIAKCAILPSVLYVISLLWAVHLEADKSKIKNVTVNTEELLSNIKRYIYLVIPIIMLVYFIVIGKSLMYSALISTLALIALCQIRKSSRMALIQVVKMAVDATLSCAGITIPCALAGIVIGIVVYTGLGLRFSALIAQVSSGSLLLALILAMVMIIIMGMGMPTSAAYIMSAILLGPALEYLKIEPIVAHMYIFYFAIISLITPPVAIASYTAAGICKTGLWETGIEGMKIASILFMIPFVFVYNPALLGIGSISEIIMVFLTCLAGVIGMGFMVIGYWHGRIHWITRMLCGIFSVMLIVPEIFTDILGITGLCIVMFLHYRAFISSSPLHKPTTPRF